MWQSLSHLFSIFVATMTNEDILRGLNPAQRDAVVSFNEPSLIIAGAGSGKTRVLTTRIAYMLAQGVAPHSILALTFTNKAAREMRERIDDMVGYGSESIWVATFHSTCVRILRRYIDRLGYDTNFTISSVLINSVMLEGINFFSTSRAISSLIEA